MNDILNAIVKATSMTEEQRIEKSLPLLRDLIEIATGEHTELQLLPDGYLAVTLGSDTGKIDIKGDSALAMIRDVINRL
jgi:hypothetical protein